MKYALIVAIVLPLCFLCSPEDIQESISGCDIEQGTLTCFELKNRCTSGYSEWTDAAATDQIKCQCCEK